MLVWAGQVRQPHASRRTVGTVIEGAGETYEGFRDRMFEEIENWASGGRGKEEDRSEGGQVESSVFPSELLSGLCGGRRARGVEI